LIDYHVHTDNSLDCKIPMTKMCEQAVELGLTEIAFTDHLNFHVRDLDLGYYKADRYFNDIEICRANFPTLKIRAGVELGEPHRWSQKIQRIVERYPYDLTLGSLHWVGNESVFNADYFRRRTPEKAFGDYFTELVHMIRHGGFDILAHVDVIKRTGFNIYGSFDSRRYEPMFRQVWEACVKQRIFPEINTKATRSAVAQFHPTAEALAWYVEAGGRAITLGSDAHHFSHIAGQFGVAQQIARSAGVIKLVQFERRKPVGVVTL
jgi:histidinol-phosphatase (PHP family)